ncbi:MAG: filamentous hemagglutinin N-terminal domain-containing protein, partial [Burkholderiales bacterium]|nr:filamentous hemagglutinin N-terminal domain-containing protein [Burkholderiales bacterium]
MQRRYRGSRNHWRQRTALAAAVAACFAGNFVLANPTGPAVAQGQASFAQQGNTLTVTNTPGTVINWQGFSIAGNEIARFIQQSQSSSVLNRVVGINPSAILGTLQSNGRVFLVNPNGITIGPGANIDVAGFMASTLNLSDADFLAGRMRFTQTPGAGSVVNHGTISTSAGGMVYLVGHDVQNSGIIRSPQGEILLAAGKSVELVDAQTPEVRVQLTAPDNQALNLGQLIAAGGRIGMYGTLVRNSGVASANTAVLGENGRIVFRAVKDVTLDAGSVTTANGPQGGSVVIQAEIGTTLVSGAVAATGSAGRGGSVQVLGQQVGLVGNASVDASGQAGGGSVLIGGDYKGGNAAVQNAGATFIGTNALVRADAGATGNGGRVIVWSDSVTRAYGLISARGGSLSGNGGFVETSSAGYLEATRAPDIAAPAGAGGTWLLDPYNIVIGTAASPGTFLDTDAGANANFVVTVPGAPSSLSPATIEAVLNAGANVIVDTTGVGLDAGNITVAQNVLKSAGVDSTLTLNAHNNISVDPGVSISSTTNKLNLVFNADQDTSGAGGVTIGAGALLSSNGGSISLNGPSGITLSGDITSAGGNIAFNHAATIAGAVDPVVSAGAGNIGFASTIDGGGRSLTTNNTGTLTLGGTISNMVDLTIQGGPSGVALPQTTLTGNLNLTSSGNITQSGALIVAGTLNLNSDTNAITATLTTTGNDFGTVSLASPTGSFTSASVTDDTNAMSIGGNAVTLSANAKGALTLTGGSYTTLNATSQTSLGQSGGVTAGTLNLNSDTNAITATLTTTGNDFG